MFPPARLYCDFLEETLPGQSLPHLSEPDWFAEDFPPPDELEWQSRWFAGDFGTRFITTAGDPVEIVDFGWWNHGAGPDFRDCRIRLAGEIRRGCIELDPDARDWDRHGHSTNAAYRDTILHLQLAHTGGGEWFTRSDEHRLIPQVRLDPATLAGRPASLPPPAARPGRCAEVFRRLPADRTLALLESAARLRLELKAARLQRTAAIHGRDQMLFQALAGALGYSRNRLPLTVLSQRLPIRLLTEKRDAAEALLFGAAGFLTGDDFEHARPATRAWLRSLWDQWWRWRDAWAPGPPRSPLRWNLAGIRPLNHPQRRIAALHALAAAWPAFRRLLHPGTFSEKALRAFTSGLHHPYWDHHYTLRAAPAPGPSALLGAGRLAEILANVCYPLLIPEKPELWKSYQKLSATGPNEKTRIAALRLFAGHPDPASLTGKVWQQQALLQIYGDFCLADQSACASCPMPAQAASVGG